MPEIGLVKTKEKKNFYPPHVICYADVYLSLCIFYIMRKVISSHWSYAGSRFYPFLHRNLVR